MRLSLTLVLSALVACFLPFIVAAHNVQHSRPDSKEKHTVHKRLTSQVIAQRQHHVRRDLIDLCINLEAGVLAPILHLLDPLAAGLRLCLCLQDLNIFLDSDVGVLLGGILGGKDSLLAKIKLLINTSPDAGHCTFPPHSHHACVAGHPCAFDCDPPYIKDPSATKCICPPPMIECNGVCGNFPHGCSSAHPWHKRQQVTGPITSYAAAKATCKSWETVCGVPGRKEPHAFECIDTTVTLDSCGGCVTPHRFADGPPSPKGIDCGRLPGVSTASCSNAQCKVARCRMGRDLNEERNECVKLSTGSTRRRVGSRMDKVSRRSTTDSDILLSTDLTSQIHAYVLLVADLSHKSQAVLTSTPSSQAAGTPSIDHAYYVGAIVNATLDALHSTTVVALVTNIDTMVNVNALAMGAFNHCGCVDTLGLQSLYQDLVAVINAALTLQNWCNSHPVGTSSNPSNPSTVPNTSPAHITVGLDDLLHSLDIDSKDNHVDVYGLRPGLSGSVNSLLDGLELGPHDVKPRSSAPSTTLDPALLQQTKGLVDAVVVLKSCESSLPPSQPSHPSGYPAVDNNLLQPILDAVNNLLNSNTVATYISNINTLVHVNSVASSTLGSCGCVDLLGLATLVENLNAVINVALGIQDWCSHNPIGVPTPLPTTTVSVVNPTGIPTVSVPPSPPPTPSQSSPPNSMDPTIIADLDLNALLNSFQSDVLGPVVVNSSIDTSLLTQIQTMVNLTLIIQSASSSLPPPAPSSSAPSVTTPVDSNLVTSIVQATLDLCTSSNVGDLLGNLGVLLDVSGSVNHTLAGCSCVDDLGLGALLTGIENLVAAVLNAQWWCGSHPVIPSAPTSTSFAPAPAPTSPTLPSTSPPVSQPLDTVIHLDLDDLLSALTLGLTTNINSTIDLHGLLNTVVVVIANIQTNSAPLPPAPMTTPSTGDPSTPPAPPTQGLITDLVQAVAGLLSLNMTTKADILKSVKGLLNLSSLLAESMDHCGCVDSLGLGALENDVDELLDALLALHAWCNSPGTGEGNDVIKLDTHDLLSALGLDGLLQVKGELPGLGLADTVNSLLHELGLGGIKRWLMG